MSVTHTPDPLSTAGNRPLRVLVGGVNPVPKTAPRAPIRVSDLVPELVDAITLDRDGETVTLRGFVSGRRCPARVKAAAAAAVRDNPVYDEDGRFSMAGHYGQLRDMLLAVVAGLEDDEADLLAGDDGEAGGIAVLKLLGWWSSDADEDDDAGEAIAPSSTTANSSQNSARSTG